MGRLIKTDGSEEQVTPRDGKAFSLDELQTFVGGAIELIVLMNGEDMYINEDGKMLDLPMNQRATLMGRAAGIADWDYILGNVIIISGDEIL